MSWTNTGGRIIRRLPLPKNNDNRRRLFVLRDVVGNDGRQRTKPQLQSKQNAESRERRHQQRVVVSSLRNPDGRRSWSSSAFFSTAPSAEFLDGDDDHDGNNGSSSSNNSNSNNDATTNSTTTRRGSNRTTAAKRNPRSSTTTSPGYQQQSTIDRIVSGGFGEYRSVDVDSFVTEDYLQKLVDDHNLSTRSNNDPPNPNLLLNMLELLHNEETHISSETIAKIFREVVRSKRVKLLERAEEVVVKNRCDPLLLRLLVTGYLNAGAPRKACELLLGWPSESVRHQPGIESYRRVLAALGEERRPLRARSGTTDERNRAGGSRKQRADSGGGNDHRDAMRQNGDRRENRREDRDHRLAHRLLKHVCKTHSRFPELSLAPDRDCFHRVLAGCSSIESLATVREILGEMTRFAAPAEQGEPGAATNTTTAAVNGNGNGAATLQSSMDTQPNVSTIRLLVKAWTTTGFSDGRPGDKRRVEMLKEGFAFLRRIEAEALLSPRHGRVPSGSPHALPTNIVDINCYNVLFNRLAELGRYQLVETMYLRLLTDYLKGEKSDVQPDTVTLHTVLKAHVQAHTEEAALSAERFLGRLDNFYEQQERIRKNKGCFLIDNINDDGNNNNDNNDCGSGTPRIAYDVQPTARARSVVSSLWVKLGKPHRAIETLDKAESLYRDKEDQLLELRRENPDTAHNYGIDTIKRFRPDKIIYRQIIGGLLSKLRDPPTVATVTEAEDVVERMCKMGHRRNLLTCNTILNGWTKSGNPDRAEIYLEETMRDDNVVPDTVSYNTIIHGHAQLGNLDRALELLTRLLEDSLSNSSLERSASSTEQQQHRRSSCYYPKPNVRTFTNILVALSKEKTIKAAEEAENLLLRMQELNDAPYNLDTRPNNVTYNAVMNCWASLSLPSSRRARKHNDSRQFQEQHQQQQQQETNGGDSGCNDNNNDHHRFGRKAEFVLRSMQGLGANERPNAISYNIVIRAYSNDMAKAEELLQDMVANGLAPTEHTYNTVVHVLNRDFRIKNKDRKLAELRERYFGSVGGGNRRASSSSDRNGSREGKNNNNRGNNRGRQSRRPPTKQNPRQKHNQQ